MKKNGGAATSRRRPPEDVMMDAEFHGSLVLRSEPGAGWKQPGASLGAARPSRRRHPTYGVPRSRTWRDHGAVVTEERMARRKRGLGAVSTFAQIGP